MKNKSILLIAAIILLSLISSSLAQTLKVITLKDGSVLKGTVVELKDNIYTLETSNLGRIQIPESDIVSINAAEIPASQEQPSENNGTQKAQIQSQVQEMQGTILSDPELMTDMQNIINDQEIQKTFSDPKFIDDILSYDPQKIQQNENVQNLMHNPKMQDLMNKIQKKIPDQK